MGDLRKLHPYLAKLVGTTISGRYEVRGVLGHGSMSAVFWGRHKTLGNDLAIKVLHPQVSLDRETSTRFDREAKVASVLEHPNCCRVTDFGRTSHGVRYMVMPMLRGQDLRTVLEKGRLEPEVAVNYAMQILRGLKHAHDHGVVHRDIKPENIILVKGPDGKPLVKITDFGITKIIRGEGADEELTSVGMIPGTPDYMSPEHAKARELDGRSDLYSLGLVLHEMLSGKQTFYHENPHELMRMQVYDKAPPLPPYLRFPLELRRCVAKLLQKDPEQRYPNASSALEVLDGIYQDLTAPPPTVEEEQIEAPLGLWQRILSFFGKSPSPAEKYS